MSYNSKLNNSGILSKNKKDADKDKNAVLLTEEDVLRLRLKKIETYENPNKMFVKKNTLIIKN